MGDTHPLNTMFPRLMEDMGKRSQLQSGAHTPLEPRRCWDVNFVNYTEGGRQAESASEPHHHRDRGCCPCSLGRREDRPDWSLQTTLHTTPRSRSKSCGHWLGIWDPGSELSSALSARWPPTR